MAAVVEFGTQSAGDVAARTTVRIVDIPASPAEHPDFSMDRRQRAGGALVVRLLAVLIAAVLLGACLMVSNGVLRAGDHQASGVSGGAGESPVRSGDYAVVGPGDTLRSVAVDHAPDADQAQVVEAIRVLNGGETSLEVGQVLALPQVER